MQCRGYVLSIHKDCIVFEYYIADTVNEKREVMEVEPHRSLRYVPMTEDIKILSLSTTKADFHKTTRDTNISLDEIKEVVSRETHSKSITKIFLFNHH